MNDRWFLVWRGNIWKRVPVTRARRYTFILEGPFAMYLNGWSGAKSAGASKSKLEKDATLRILHDMQWWEYKPGKWKFGGEW